MNKKTKFEKELSNLINRLSLEGGSNTPDFILARYLVQCLEAYEAAGKHVSHGVVEEPTDQDLDKAIALLPVLPEPIEHLSAPLPYMDSPEVRIDERNKIRELIKGFDGLLAYLRHKEQ